jgi:hypothetical protein
MPPNVVVAVGRDARKKVLSEWRKSLPIDFQPTFSRGKWHSPKKSLRELAVERKKTLLRGQEWPYEKPRFPMVVHFKGHKRIARAEERRKLIAEKMAEMPKKIEEYYREMRSRRIPKKSAYDSLMREDED